MKTVQGLASAVARREGKKSPTTIGNIRETIKVLLDLAAEGKAKDDYTIVDLINAEISKRAKRLVKGPKK